MGMDDTFFMMEALKQAKEAAANDEVPVGAVIIYRGQIIARAHNQVERLHDPTAHAEMIAITQAANFLTQKWLLGCQMFVTLEPCSMCAGALVLSRIERLVFGADDPKSGACGSVLNISRHERLNHRLEVESGLLESLCGKMVTEFFKKKRSLAKLGENIS
jgi:tRNA(adenine34) deaminase